MSTDTNTETQEVAIDYLTAPLETLDVVDLTDAIGIPESAAIAGTSARAIYTQRNTGMVGVDRVQLLIEHFRLNEQHYRQRLAIKRTTQRARKRAKK